ncbi:MAG: YjbQ family protein [Candidatus Aminicenantes bacterium]|nr:YjbQ family protein [Candidatus Aminicenantes bacterium]
MKTIEVRSAAREELIDITAAVAGAVRESPVKNGLCLVFVPHTTAGILINENADPDVKADLLLALRKSAPEDLPYGHGEGNSPAHVKACLTGSSVSVIIENGRLALGTWQAVYFAEFDGPRRRLVHIAILGGS